MQLNKKRAAAVVAATTVAVAGAGVAFAFWTTTGHGTSSATTGTTSPWQIDVTPVVTDALTPGGPVDTYTYTVTNNSSGFQKLNNVNITVASADSNGNATPWVSQAGCGAGDFSIDSAGAGQGVDDAAEASDIEPGGFVTGSISLQMVDSASDQNGCKNATVPLYLAAS